MKYLQKSFSVPYMGKKYSEGWERIFGKKDDLDCEQSVCKWNGAKLIIKMLYHGYADHRYNVVLIDGEWPSDDDLITLCDGDMPPKRRHFGGEVHKSLDKKSAKVTVFVD